MYLFILVFYASFRGSKGFFKAFYVKGFFEIGKGYSTMIHNDFFCRAVLAGDQHRLGHRARLRERFLVGNVEAVADYELLELILFAAFPRGDIKPLAKDLLKAFKALLAL